MIVPPASPLVRDYLTDPEPGPSGLQGPEPEARESAASPTPGPSGLSQSYITDFFSPTSPPSGTSWENFPTYLPQTHHGYEPKPGTSRGEEAPPAQLCPPSPYFGSIYSPAPVPGPSYSGRDLATPPAYAHQDPLESGEHTEQAENNSPNRNEWDTLRPDDLVWEWWSERNPGLTTVSNMGDAPTTLEIEQDTNRIDISDHSSADWQLPYSRAMAGNSGENQMNSNPLDDSTSTLPDNSSSIQTLVDENDSPDVVILNSYQLTEGEWDNQPEGEQRPSGGSRSL